MNLWEIHFLKKRIDTLGQRVDKHKLLALPCCRKNRAACLSREYNLIYYSGLTFLFNIKSLSFAHTHTRGCCQGGKSKFLKTRADPQYLHFRRRLQHTHVYVYTQNPCSLASTRNIQYLPPLSGCRFIVFIFIVD
jgi:hypothetical protein